VDGGSATQIWTLPANHHHIDIWGADGVPTVLTGEEPARYRSLFPPQNGYRVVVITMAPESDQGKDIDRQEVARRWDEKYPGLHANMFMAMDPEMPGMHWTKTVDIGFVLEGEIELELDEATTLLRAGECFVQNGTRHSWHNRTDAPCKMLLILVGAEQAAL
jgi:mannose-6-phosphate isomerase-like protein (cupin superfamily)